MGYLSLVFLIKPPCTRDFPLPCLITEGYQTFIHPASSQHGKMLTRMVYPRLSWSPTWPGHFVSWAGDFQSQLAGNKNHDTHCTRIHTHMHTYTHTYIHVGVLCIYIYIYTCVLHSVNPWISHLMYFLEFSSQTSSDLGDHWWFDGAEPRNWRTIPNLRWENPAKT